LDEPLCITLGSGYVLKKSGPAGALVHAARNALRTKVSFGNARIQNVQVLFRCGKTTTRSTLKARSTILSGYLGRSRDIAQLQYIS